MTDPLITAARFLVAQLPWLRHATTEQGSPVAVDVFREIGDCAARMRSLVEGPREQKYLGPCGAPVGDEEELFEGEWQVPVDGPICSGDVYGIPGAEKGRCKTCGATVDQAERRAWLDAEVRQYAYTAREIADAYGLNVKTIRTWHNRGQLAQHGEHRGLPLHNLGDVLDLAAIDAARRETRRADRERRGQLTGGRSESMI